MLKKTIIYTDYNDEVRKEDFYFNFSRAELLMMETSRPGGMRHYYNRIVNNQDTVAIMECFKELIHKAIGYKSDDGKRFVKSEEYAVAFEQSEAYSELLEEILEDTDVALEFFNGMFPKTISKELDAVKKVGE